MEGPKDPTLDVPRWIADFRTLVDSATPGPWWVGAADDENRMTSVFITTEKPQYNEYGSPTWESRVWPHPRKVVAITLMQTPCYAVPERDEENVRFIAVSRTAVPRLCGEVERAYKAVARLRHGLESLLKVVASADSGQAPSHAMKEEMESARLLLEETDLEAGQGDPGSPGP